MAAIRKNRRPDVRGSACCLLVAFAVSESGGAGRKAAAPRSPAPSQPDQVAAAITAAPAAAAAAAHVQNSDGARDRQPAIC